MRILVLAHYYPPEMGGAAARLHGLSRWLAAYGHQVTVITCLPNYPSGRIDATYRGKLYVREEKDGVRLLRTWVYASPVKGSARRLANYFSFVVSATLAGWLARGPWDVVLGSSPPLFLGIAGWLIARVRRIPFVFDIRDIWPDVAVDAGEFAPDAPITRLGRWLARFLYRRADRIVPVTELKRERIAAQGVPAEKLTVVTNGVDLDRVPDAAPDRREELGLGGHFVVLYAGLIGIAQGVEIAVEAAHRLVGDSRVHFLIVGDGVRRAAIEREVSERGLSNVTMLPRQPREAMPALLATADVCLVPLSAAGIVDAVPSKLLEAWAHRRAVILAAEGESAKIVQEAGGGLVVAPGDGAALSKAVRQLADEPERCDAMAKAGRAYVETRYDRRDLARQMERVLCDVAQGAPTKRDPR